jgi:excisionase family DNA binding protein
MERTARQVLSRSEVARLFEVSPATVARWAKQGKLPYRMTLGGRRRFPREEILTILGAVNHEREAECERAS